MYIEELRLITFLYHFFPEKDPFIIIVEYYSLNWRLVELLWRCC